MGTPYVDPDIYSEPWPKLTLEQKRDFLASFMGLTWRYYDVVLGEVLGVEKAKEVTATVWERLLVDMIGDLEERLGVKGRKDAIAFTKVNAYLEEEIFEYPSTTAEASPNRGVRALVRCLFGDNMRKEDCDWIVEGTRRFVERYYPGLTHKIETCYQDTHICTYAIERKKE